MDRLLYWLCLVQGIYFFLTGVWPIVHVRSFMAVTGPKHDVWLVKTVGALVTVIGVAIVAGGVRRSGATPELLVVAIGSAFVLMMVDVVYLLRRVIAPIYLADAVAEALLLGGWAVYLLGRNGV